MLVVNLFSVAGTNLARRPDVVVFGNGLPLAVVELKNPADESADVWKAYSQRHEVSELLEYQLEKVVRGFFDPELFLDYMRYFALFEADGDWPIKKNAGYHQLYGVREAVRVTTIAVADSETPLCAEALNSEAMRMQRFWPHIFSAISAFQSPKNFAR